MGILDEAIREHLDLKRDHGAEESEIEGLEAEAFGPADRPDATAPEAEAETRIISPGSSLTAPAGEGDQLDKVFDASNEAEAEAEPSAGEHKIPVPESETAEGAAKETSAEPPAEEALAAETAEAGPPPQEDAAPEAVGDEGGDAGDALERERENLAGQPTEHYDVDAAIAEEDEIDVLSESSLSDELDRALDGPSEPEAEATAAVEPESEPESASDEKDENLDQEATEPDADSPVEDVESEGEEEDVLEDTPDFLEETPEHDKLWFEQKEPKDFDFGD
ncbi:MAG: hypothetical protein JJE10_04280 [Thermoleophilia bacterium]|nr:hypothetical protein [Thermoleophilia bacterium]